MWFDDKGFKTFFVFFSLVLMLGGWVLFSGIGWIWDEWVRDALVHMLDRDTTPEGVQS